MYFNWLQYEAQTIDIHIVGKRFRGI